MGNAVIVSSDVPLSCCTQRQHPCNANVSLSASPSSLMNLFVHRDMSYLKKETAFMWQKAKHFMFM